MNFVHLFNYLLFRLFGFCIAFTPHPILYGFSLLVGRLLYYVHREFRKKVHCNLAIAFGHTPFSQRKKIAIGSFQNLVITCLEFFWLKRNRSKLLQRVALEGSKEIYERLVGTQSIVFMTAHLANWEIPFLVASHYGQGVGVARPIKNRFIYNYLLSVRQMEGNRVILPKRALRESLAALRSGLFAGSLADQAFLESNYSYPFFGTRAWATTMPALLAYKTNSPLVVAITRREKRDYRLIVQETIWPNLENPVREEIVRLMDHAFGYLQKNIAQSPQDWLWQHDRWKQPAHEVKPAFCFAFILIILPPNPELYLPHLKLFRTIYPKAFFTFLIPKNYKEKIEEKGADTTFLTYESENDLKLQDWRIQLVLDFYNSKGVQRHYKRMAAQRVLSINQMRRLSQKESIPDIIAHTLCKPGSHLLRS